MAKRRSYKTYKSLVLQSVGKVESFMCICELTSPIKLLGALHTTGKHIVHELWCVVLSLLAKEVADNSNGVL